ncbi:MAG: fibronectin type III domain-containing protein, partial [Bacilli bacterium]|nr:fibronectin type III domain-containing protein [Bacilli bacterium]
MKLKKCKNVILICLFAIFSLALTPVPSISEDLQPPLTLFENIEPQQLNKNTTQSKKSHIINVHTEALKSSTISFNLLDRGDIIAVRDRMIANSNNKPSTWIGRINGEEDSEVFLTFKKTLLVGTIRINSDFYEIKIKKNGTQVITKVDLSKNPVGNDEKFVEDFLTGGGLLAPYPQLNENFNVSADGAGTIIDLMVVYTAKAKSNASGQAGIETKIANAVAMANQAYINSHVDMQLNVVYTGEISYAESGNMAASLSDLAGAYDGKMDAVHTLRNQYGADQVVLITTDANYCGIGYLMSYPDVSFAPYAFSVVHDDSAYSCLSNGTLAHELGHNQGNMHDRASSSNPGAYDYSYGYRLCETGGFRDIMSYACTGVPRVNYFSNPNVFLPTGQVTGTAIENTALSMNNTKSIVSSFRGTPVALPPAVPTGLTAVAISSNQIQVTWADNSNNETGFRLERSTNGINWTEFAVTAANVTSYTDTGLAASTTYYYRVRAYNSNGNSNYSNTAITSVVPPVALPPAVPTGLTAVAISSNQIQVTWTDNSNNETGFWLERSTDGVNWALLGYTAANVTNYTDTVLATSTTYYYRAGAYNSNGNSNYSNTAITSVVPPVALPPAVPTGLNAVAISSTEIRVTWADNSNNETGFRLERSTNGVNWTEFAVTASNTASYTDTGLSASTTYYYRVRAYNSNGNSNYSNTYTAITQSSSSTVPAVPTGLTAVAISSNQIQVTWTDNSNNETGFWLERSTDGVNW